MGNSPATTRFRRDERDGFKLQWLDDGTDYPALWEQFRQGQLEGRSLHNWEKQSTWKINFQGRSFIFKRGRPPKPRLSIWDLVSGTFASRLLRETWQAVDQGCGMIPRTYLVAEKFSGFKIWTENYLIIEFLEGRVLEGEVTPDWAADLGEALHLLHGWGLASGAPHPWNVVRTEDGLKMIDISMRGPVLLCQGYDVFDSRRRFGTEVRVDKPALRLVLKLIQLKHRWKMFRRGLKRRLGKTGPDA